eukprot:6193887-Pleurochrysis_carterae.AAC.5
MPTLRSVILILPASLSSHPTIRWQLAPRRDFLSYECLDAHALAQVSEPSGCLVPDALAHKPFGRMHPYKCLSMNA